MGKSGKVNKSEPASIALVNEHVKQLFKTAGWYHFLSKFSGENIVVILMTKVCALKLRQPPAKCPLVS